MNQTTITLIVSVVGMVGYYACITLCRRPFHYVNMFTFAGLCAAVVIGIYICGAALHFIKNADAEGNRLSIGLLGAGMSVMCGNQAFAMLKSVLRRKKAEVVPTPKSTDETEA